MRVYCVDLSLHVHYALLYHSNRKKLAARLVFFVPKKPKKMLDLMFVMCYSTSITNITYEEDIV